MESYRIIGFTKANLFNLFFAHKPKSYQEYADAYLSIEFDKSSYLYSYLHVLNARHVVVEENYLSKDYARDYSLYYNSSFRQWEKSCQRLHFFTDMPGGEAFEPNFIKAIINPKRGKAVSFWKDHYLGFIVIKPIPGSSIGYSLLRHYNFSSKHPLHDPARVYFATRLYHIHIFGHEVEIDSLAFQEQDGMVAACATMCVWFVQQKALITNLVVRKSPGEITRDVGELLDKGERMFPNSGLKVPELCRAIQKNGLEPLVRNYKDKTKERFPTYLKRYVYAYHGLQLPIIVIHQEKFTPKEEQEPKTVSKPLVAGEVVVSVENQTSFPAIYKQPILGQTRHAVAVCGFKVVDPWNTASGMPSESRSIFKADYLIEKFFVHDDQFGPFASLDINENEDYCEVFYKHRTEESDEMKMRHFELDSIIIPLLPRVKITYDQIEIVVGTFNALFGLFLSTVYNNGADSWKSVLWEIRLMYSDDYKQEVRLDLNRSAKDRLRRLMYNLPKFVWVARALVEQEDEENGELGEVLFAELLFDAGGLSNTMLCVACDFMVAGLEKDFKTWLLDKMNADDFLEEFNPFDLYLEYLSTK